MELTEGLWTNAQLAEWFGMREKTFKNNKEKKLIELTYYAEFEKEKGKIRITKVINPFYSKDVSTNYLKIRDKVDEVWDETGLDTCSRVGQEIYDILSEEDENFKLKSGTVVNYTYRGRNELYGKPFVGGGKLGNCVYIWCKRDQDGNYSLLTEEEQRIKQNLQTKYFGDATEKQILVKGMVEAGELSKEEAWEALEEMTNMNTGNFMGFLAELQAELGCQVVKGTYVNRLEAKESAF